jgi:hypothetical protein
LFLGMCWGSVQQAAGAEGAGTCARPGTCLDVVCSITADGRALLSFSAFTTPTHTTQDPCCPCFTHLARGPQAAVLCGMHQQPLRAGTAGSSAPSTRLAGALSSDCQTLWFAWLGACLPLPPAPSCVQVPPFAVQSLVQGQTSMYELTVSQGGSNCHVQQR